MTESPNLARAVTKAKRAYLRRQWARLLAVCNGDRDHAKRVWKDVWRKQGWTP